MSISVARFVWMFWMQPALLHQQLSLLHQVSWDRPAFSLWRRGGAHRVYLLRCAAMLLSISVIASVIAQSPAIALYGIVAGFSCAHFASGGAWAGVVVGTAVALPWTLVATGLASLPVAIGAAVALAFDMLKVEPALTMLILSVPALAGLSMDPGDDDWSIFLAGCKLFSAAAAVAYRVHLWPAQLALQAIAIERDHPKWSAPLWFDRIHLPLPGLRQLLQKTASADPATANQLIEACRRSPGLTHLAQQVKVKRPPRARKKMK